MSAVSDASKQKGINMGSQNLTTLLQYSVVALLRRGGQNRKHLQHISSGCGTPDLIKIGQCLTELFKK